MSNNNWIQDRFQRALDARRVKGTLRSLQTNEDKQESEAIDFSSNDYLGLAHDVEQQALVEQTFREKTMQTMQKTPTILGATGSRLLSGDNTVFHQLELYLCQLHNRPAALLFNSGYDANLAVVSCLPCDVVLYDEYAHNSLHMGMRLWRLANTSDSAASDDDDENAVRTFVPFQHNSVTDLRAKLAQQQQSQQQQNIVVLVESVYSMDGDVAPLKEMLQVAQTYNAQMIVDEAHGLGVFGRKAGTTKKNSNNNMLLPPGTGVLAEYELEHHPALLCSIHTFGKAAGCHGAVACFAHPSHKDYLCNYGYPFIYSTALPLHSLITLECSYQTMTGPKGDELRQRVFALVQLFRTQLEPYLMSSSSSNNNTHIRLLPSTTPIQALMIPDNQECTNVCQDLYQLSHGRIRLYPIKSPTVPAGQERIRIILHAHNTQQQVTWLVALIVQILRKRHLVVPSSSSSSSLPPTKSRL